MITIRLMVVIAALCLTSDANARGGGRSGFHSVKHQHHTPVGHATRHKAHNSHPHHHVKAIGHHDHAVRDHRKAVAHRDARLAERRERIARHHQKLANEYAAGLVEHRASGARRHSEKSRQP